MRAPVPSEVLKTATRTPASSSIVSGSSNGSNGASCCVLGGSAVSDVGVTTARVVSASVCRDAARGGVRLPLLFGALVSLLLVITGVTSTGGDALESCSSAARSLPSSVLMSCPRRWWSLALRTA